MLSAPNEDGDELIYNHFNSHGHLGLQDLSIRLIDRVKVKEDLAEDVSAPLLET